MTNYRKKNLWLGFLALNDFPSHVAQPTESDIERLRISNPDLPEEELLLEFAAQAMLDHTNPKAWRSFLKKHQFLAHIQPPTDEELARFHKCFPKLNKKELLLEYAEQNACPDLDFDEFENEAPRRRHAV